MDTFEFQGQRDKYMTLGIMGAMFLTSLIDMIVDWVNFTHLCSMEFKYGLVIGPPPDPSMTALLIFNIVGTCFFFAECANTFTILTHGRRTKVPIAYEQIAIILLEEIPLAAINLDIVTCRLHHVSNTQVAAGLFGIINCGIRLYAYGWYEEKEYSNLKPVHNPNFKKTLKVAVYITVTVLWIVLIVALAFTWQDPWVNFEETDGSTETVNPSWGEGVSILLLQVPHGKNVSALDINGTLTKQGVPLTHPWLVKNMADLLKAENLGIGASVTYPCFSNASLAPEECTQYQSLRFHIEYANPNQDNRPYGGMRYNIAGLVEDTCTPFHDELFHDLRMEWKLQYLQVKIVSQGPNNTTVLVSPPWPGICTVPEPEYDATLPVC